MRLHVASWVRSVAFRMRCLSLASAATNDPGDHWASLLDRVQVGTVGRQEQEPCADAPDGAANCGTLMAGEIIHDHHITCRECRDETLLDIAGEAVAVDRLIHDTRRIDPVAA